VPDPATLLVFAGASAALVAVPGPAVLYVVSRSIAHGRSGGLMSVLGVETGNLLQVIAASAGLAAVIASSSEAFSVIRYAGAAYLVFLGIGALMGRRDPEEVALGPARSSRRLYWEGVLVGTLNPKLALFLLAFLPQFIDPSAGPVWSQTLALGVVFVVVASIGDALFALLAGSAADSVRTGRAAKLMPRIGGGVLVGLGVFTAVAGDSRN
jgi:threonine/homoserine/homoserine lactone efflux protein